MKFKNLTIIALISLGLIGCGNQKSEVNTQNNKEVELEERKDNLKEIKKDSSKETSTDSVKEEKQKLKNEDQKIYTINLGVLAGPTSAGAINMIEESKEGKEKEFKINETVEAMPDSIVTELVSGKLDMAIIPPNLAASVYNKTNGAIKALATNNLGVLYIVQNGGDEINSISDLMKSGEKVYAAGKGSTPEIAINEVISTYGYDINDLDIEFFPDATEVAQKLIAEEVHLALIPEPMVSSVLLNAKNARVALNINNLYEEQMDNPLISAVLVARNEYLDTINVDDFLKLYKDSIDKANTDTDKTAALLSKYDIMKEPVAKKALPNLSLKYIDGEEFHKILSEYLERLYNVNPKMIGGELPADEFYYQK